MNSDSIIRPISCEVRPWPRLPLIRPDLRIACAGGRRYCGVGPASRWRLAKPGDVYCTGRILRDGAGFRHQAAVRAQRKKVLPAGRIHGPPETIEELRLVTARAARACSRRRPPGRQSGREIVAQIRAEQGKLHVLVNDISESAEHEFGKTFCKPTWSAGSPCSAMRFIRISSRSCAAPLLIERSKLGPNRLIGRSATGDTYSYRGHLFFDSDQDNRDQAGLRWVRAAQERMSRPSLTPVFCAQKGCWSVLA